MPRRGRGRKTKTPEQLAADWKNFNEGPYNLWGELHRFITSDPMPITLTTIDYSARNW